MTTFRPGLIWLPLALAAACGGNGGGGPSNDGASEAADAGASETPLDCAAASAGLALKLHATPGAQCTVIVRLDFQTLAALAYQIVCGPAATVSEAQARATAAADTGFGADPTAAPALNPPDPGDAFVFYEQPHDRGGAAAVSARTGLTVFGGGVTSGGRGEITYPATWRPAAELASGCPSAEGIPTARSYSVGAPVSDASVASAVAAVTDTAVPSAIWRSGQVTGAVALGYARTVGSPVTDGGATAGDEWIVLVNSQ